MKTKNSLAAIFSLLIAACSPTYKAVTAEQIELATLTCENRGGMEWVVSGSDAPDYLIVTVKCKDKAVIEVVMPRKR